MAKRSLTARAKEALAFARQLAEEGKDWVTAQNALYGLEGKCTELFPTREEREAFAQTEERRQMSKLLAGLPAPPVRQEGPTTPEANADLHVRLPRTLLATLRAEAEAKGVELNQMIVTALSELVRVAANGGRIASPRKKRV
jgi:hypothetical protein